jgi:hypothetical protein
LKVPHLNFSLIICHIRDIDVWSRGEGKSTFFKVSDGTRVIGKCLGNFLIPCFGSGCVWEWRNIHQTVRKKCTTFITERIVALMSVNKIFPESYDFAARNRDNSRNSIRLKNDHFFNYATKPFIDACHHQRQERVKKYYGKLKHYVQKVCSYKDLFYHVDNFIHTSMI